jgi:hypothetical protein
MKAKSLIALGLSLALLAPTYTMPQNVWAKEEVEQVEAVKFDLVSTDYTAKKFKLDIYFSRQVDLGSITADNIHIRNIYLGDDQTADADIKIKADDANQKITVTLKEDLDQDAQYVIIVENILDVEGNTIVEEKRRSFRTGEQEVEEVTEVADVTELKGTGISPSAIKFTWKYSKAEESKIDGFYIYDDEGYLLTEDNDVNAKDRDYVLTGLKPGKSYTITVKAFKLFGEDEEILESEGVTGTGKTKILQMPTFSENNLVAVVKGTSIQYYWSYKNYQDYSENFTDYEIQIADDKNFTKNVVKAPLYKGNVLHSKALKVPATKNGIKLTKYFRIVNKAHKLYSSVTTKTIHVKATVAPKAPKVVVGEVKGNSVKVLITDLSTNESTFNLYYINENGQKQLYTILKSTTGVKTGEVYVTTVSWLAKGKFHGFKATAVDKYGVEGKESQMAELSETEEEED